MRGSRRLVLLGLLVVATAAIAEEPTKTPPDGKVSFVSGSAGIVVGYRWGNGTLTYQGKEYPFSIEGIEVGDVGGGEARAAGDVFGLKKLEDFSGTYQAVSANLTLGGGGGGWHLQNEKGVRLELNRTTVGLKLTMGYDGMKLKLK